MQDETVPPILSLLSFTPDISFINFFLDNPNIIGKPKEWKIEILLIRVILCFKFLPNPIPGSNIILLFGMPCLLASSILFSKKNINIIWNNEVSEILGDENGVNALKLISTKQNKTEIIKVNGVFIAIGHSPSTKPFKDVLEMDNEGYIIAQKPGTTITNLDGVFAAGDCVDKIYRQAVTAAGMGCMAALDAEKWIQSHNL